VQAFLSSWSQPRRWRWRQWFVLALLTVLVVGAALLPGLLRREIVITLAKSTSANVRLAAVDLNPLRGRLVLRELSLTPPGEEQPVIAIGEIVGRVRLRALLRGELVIEGIRVHGLRAAVVRQADGSLNLAKLAYPPRPHKPSTPETDLPTLTIQQLQLVDVMVDYRDATLPSAKPVCFSLSDLTTGEIALQAKGLAAPVHIYMRGSVNKGGVAGDGQAYWSRSETRLEATMNLQRLPLNFIEPYLQRAFSMRKLAGEADARVRYRLHSGGGQPAVHTMDGALALTNLSFVDPSSEQTALHVQDGRIVVEQIDFLHHDLRLAAVELRNPHVLVLQTPVGLNWTQFLLTHDHTAQSEEHGSRSNLSWRSHVQSVKVTGGEITYYNSEWPATQTIKIAPEEVELQEVGDGTTESPLRFSAHIGEGQVSGAGTVQLSPLRVQVQAQLSKVAVSPFQPLLVNVLGVRSAEGIVNGNVQTEVTAAHDQPLVLVSGELDASGIALDGLPAAGNLLSWTNAHIAVREGSTLTPLSLEVTTQFTNVSLQRLPQGDVSFEQATSALRLTRHAETQNVAASQLENAAVDAAEPVGLAVQGTFEVKGFLLAHGPEKAELLSCYQARGRLKAGSRLSPLDLRLTDVALEYPYAQGFRTAAGQFQLMEPTVEAPSLSTDVDAGVEAAPPQASPIESSSALSPQVHIERITLIGGQVYFEDHAVSPLQTIYWQDIRIDLSDVGYPLARPAAFALHTYNMDGALIEASGTTERQGEQLLTHVRGMINHMTLPRFNAYLAPVLGYKVRKGAVSVKWELMMPGDLLRANAAVTLHDLGLSGKQGDSELEQHVGLPMALIIALLKDLNGNINLQLPVEGKLNEPGFRLGGTIWRAIRDVLLGAVMSPLKLLGAVFSREETLEDFSLEPIPFTPGSTEPTPAGKEQLNRLRLLLAQRPELDLQLSGFSSLADQQVLRDRLLLQQLERAEPSATPGAEPGAEKSGDAQKVTPEAEVRQFLAKQLDHGAGQSAALSEQAASLLQQLQQQTTLAPQALKQLAEARVQTVIAALTTGSRGISAGRLHRAPDKPRGRNAPEVQYMIQAREKR